MTKREQLYGVYVLILPKSIGHEISIAESLSLLFYSLSKNPRSTERGIALTLEGCNKNTLNIINL